MRRLSKLLHIGIINTVRLNVRYFGLEGVFYPIIFASRNLKILSLKGTVKCENASLGAIRLGLECLGTVDKRFNRCIWQNSGEIIFQGKAYLGAGTKIVNSGQLVFGNNCAVTGNSTFLCYEHIYIGSNSFISWECMISDTDFHKIKSISDGTCLNDNKPVHIGEHVWIGARCTVLKGSRIPDDSVLAAGSIVTKKLKSNNAIYVSNNIVKGDITWEA